MRIFVDIEEDTELGRYFLSCARIRGISPRSLLRRLVKAISEDHLVASVLDDTDTIKDRQKGEHRYSRRLLILSEVYGHAC
jgi:hypothetical protein